MARYYALWHDPQRTALVANERAPHVADAYVAVSQTGFDLFRPLVTLRAENTAILPELLRRALRPGWPYQLVAPILLAPILRQNLEMADIGTTRIYSLSPARFKPIVNVLVQRAMGSDGVASRFQIQSGGQVVAVSGTNWRSPEYAEVYVHVDPQGRDRGWGKSVVSACTADLVTAGLRPLFMVREGNQAAMRLADGLGYRDTGHRELIATAVLPESS
jgi:hypothetical protein